MRAASSPVRVKWVNFHAGAEKVHSLAPRVQLSSSGSPSAAAVDGAEMTVFFLGRAPVSATQRLT
jgi:hypothetical protein